MNQSAYPLPPGHKITIPLPRRAANELADALIAGARKKTSPSWFKPVANEIKRQLKTHAHTGVILDGRAANWAGMKEWVTAQRFDWGFDLCAVIHNELQAAAESLRPANEDLSVPIHKPENNEESLAAASKAKGEMHAECERLQGVYGNSHRCFMCDPLCDETPIGMQEKIEAEQRERETPKQQSLFA